MKDRLKLLIAPVAALIFELLPFGIKNPAYDEAASLPATFSYFSVVPFAQYNFGPFLTAVLTCVLIILVAIYVFEGKNRRVPRIKTFAVFSFALSLSPVFEGFKNLTVPAIGIAAMLGLELYLVIKLLNSIIAEQKAEEETMLKALEAENGEETEDESEDECEDESGNPDD